MADVADVANNAEFAWVDELAYEELVDVILEFDVIDWLANEADVDVNEADAQDPDTWIGVVCANDADIDLLDVIEYEAVDVFG